MFANEVRPPPTNSWFVTITLPPKLYKYSSVTQYELTYGEIQHIMYSCCADFECIPEHTQQGNLHYHGWFTVAEVTSKILLMNKLKRSRQLGFIKLTTEPIITDESIRKTHTYMIKEYKDTKKILRGVPRKSLVISAEDVRVKEVSINSVIQELDL